MIRTIVIGAACALLNWSGAASAQSVHRELPEFTQTLDRGSARIYRARAFRNAPVYGVFLLCLNEIDHERDLDEIEIYSGGGDGGREALAVGECRFIATDYLRVESDVSRRSAELRVRLIETGLGAPQRDEEDEE